MFPRNQWYVAAWGDELEPGKLLARTLLNEPLPLRERVRAIASG